MCGCDDSELPAFMDQRFLKARCPHSCCECSSVIEIGHSYHRYAGKWDGAFCTYKVCVGCQQMREDIEKNGCSVAFGCLQEVLDG